MLKAKKLIFFKKIFKSNGFFFTKSHNIAEENSKISKNDAQITMNFVKNPGKPFNNIRNEGSYVFNEEHNKKQTILKKESSLSRTTINAKRLIMKIEKNLLEIKNLVANNSKFALRNKIESLLLMYHLEQKNPDNNIEEISLMNKLLIENKDYLSLSLTNKGTINNIIEFYISQFLNFNRTQLKEKKTTIDILNEFLYLIFTSLDLEVYKEFNNKKISIIPEVVFDFYRFRSEIANKPTYFFFQELDILPKSFSEKLLPFLLNEKKNKNENKENYVDYFFDNLQIYLVNNEAIEYSHNFSLDPSKLLNLLTEFTTLHEFNEFLYFLYLDKNYKQDENEILRKFFLEQFSMKFPEILDKAPIQTVIFFLFLSSRSQYPGSPEFHQLLIYEKNKKDIKTLSQFLAIYSQIIDINFTNIDSLVIMLYKYALEQKFSLNSFEILEFIKLTQTFKSISKQVNILNNLVKIIDELLRKKFDDFTNKEKIYIFCFFHELDIPIKPKLTNSILKFLNECPAELIPKLIINFLNFTHGIVNFDELEGMAKKVINSLDISQKLNIFISFVYHLKGSDEFIGNLLNMMYKELNFESPIKFEETPLKFLCRFYQIVFTLKHFYKTRFECLQIKKLNDWYENFQNKYDEYDQPFYPNEVSFSKGEHEIKVFLMEFKIPFETEKKLLLHKVDFLIDNRLCLEINGRHHYVNKFILCTKDKWKERNLTVVGGYIYRSILIEQWEISNNEKKKQLLRQVLVSAGIDIKK